MWQGIFGHDDVVQRFRQSLAAGRLASTYLFVGPRGIGKRSLALKLAQALLCQAQDAARLSPCGVCQSCVLARAGSHPDLLLVAKPPGKSSIPLELFIGSKERRMREGLCHDIGVKPFLGGRRVAIIDDADEMNIEGANCLLKTLEEPPPRSVLILIGTSPERQLPTIRSRCQMVRFRPLAEDVLIDALVQGGLAGDREEAARLVPFCQGSVERAVLLADRELVDFGGRLGRALAQTEIDSVGLAREVAAFVDEAGREARARRDRLRQVLDVAVDHYRRWMRTSTDEGGSPAAIEQITGCLDRTLAALEQVERNANQATLIECWLDDLARISAGQHVATAAR